MSAQALFDRLAEFDREARKAAGEGHGAYAAHAALERKINEAEAALAAYHRAGVEDEAREDALIGQLNRLRARTDPNARKGEIRDLAAQSKATAATSRARSLKDAKQAFVRDHRDELRAHLLAEAEQRQKQLDMAVSQVEAVSLAWDATAQRIASLAEGLGINAGEIPGNPLGASLPRLRMDLNNKLDTPAPQSWVNASSDEIVIDARTGHPVGAQ